MFDIEKKIGVALLGPIFCVPWMCLGMESSVKPSLGYYLCGPCLVCQDSASNWNCSTVLPNCFKGWVLCLVVL